MSYKSTRPEPVVARTSTEAGCAEYRVIREKSGLYAVERNKAITWKGVRTDWVLAYRCTSRKLALVWLSQLPEGAPPPEK